jgi:hypothetical protein
MALESVGGVAEVLASGDSHHSSEELEPALGDHLKLMVDSGDVVVPRRVAVVIPDESLFSDTLSSSSTSSREDCPGVPRR